MRKCLTVQYIVVLHDNRPVLWFSHFEKNKFLSGEELGLLFLLYCDVDICNPCVGSKVYIIMNLLRCFVQGRCHKEIRLSTCGRAMIRFEKLWRGWPSCTLFGKIERTPELKGIVLLLQNYFLLTFHVLPCYPPGVLHDLPVGNVPGELAMCLGIMIKKKCFSLEDLNKIIK